MITEDTDTARSESRDWLSVTHLFEAQATRTPEAVAVISDGQTVTYGALNAQANRLAHFLRRRGAGPGTRVGLCLDRSPAMAAAVLGVLKAGAAYVPLDPAYPAARLRLMQQDAQPRIILTQRAQPPSWPGARVVCLDDAPALASESGANPRPETGPEHLGYIIYTSGSTGTPKGVALPHRALSNLIQWQMGATFCQTARTAQFASLSFDVSFQEMFATWCGGGALVLVPESLRRDPRGLVRLLDEQQVARLFLPFVALQQLAEEVTARGGAPRHLREVITAGEQLKITPAIVALFEALPHATLHNHYGPSETHVATAHTLTGTPQGWPSLPPIGRPIANLEAHVLDAQMRPVPAGAEGELFLGGAGLAQGYWGQPEMTAQRFLPNPFSINPAARLYRTGDLVRQSPDGGLEFLGRTDAQVKIRGFRVETGEVETALMAYPGVVQAAAAGHEVTPGDTRLIAYVVAGPSVPPTATELRAFLELRLPDALIPSSFVFQERLPLTPSGKVDRRALPAPARERPTLAVPYAAPVGAQEQQLLGIWQDVLQIAPIGVHDNFFDLGGQSLQVAQVHRRLCEVMRPQPDITLLFQYPTVSLLAAHLGPKSPPDAPAREIQSRAQQQRAAFAQRKQRRAVSGGATARDERAANR